MSEQAIPNEAAREITDDEAARWLRDNDLYAVTHVHVAPECGECNAGSIADALEVRLGQMGWRDRTHWTDHELAADLARAVIRQRPYEAPGQQRLHATMCFDVECPECASERRGENPT